MTARQPANAARCQSQPGNGNDWARAEQKGGASPAAIRGIFVFGSAETRASASRQGGNSRSHRDPDEGAEPRRQLAEDELAEVSRRWMIRRLSVPPEIRSGMRTVDQVRRAVARREGAFQSRRLIERGGQILDELELAVRERPPGMGDATGPGFAEARNAISGESGLIARRWLAPGVHSRPLGELLLLPKDLGNWKDSAMKLMLNASSGRLQVYLCEGRGEASPRPVAFAAVKNAKRADSVFLHARLLVTPFEVEQWSDPWVEAQGNRVH